MFSKIAISPKST